MQSADSHEQAAGPLEGRTRHRGAAAQQRLPKPHLPAAALRGGWATVGRAARPRAAGQDTRPRQLGEELDGRRASAAPAERGNPAGATAERPEARPRRGRERGGAGPPEGAGFSGPEREGGAVGGRGLGGGLPGAEPLPGATGGPSAARRLPSEPSPCGFG